MVKKKVIFTILPKRRITARAAITLKAHISGVYGPIRFVFSLPYSELTPFCFPGDDESPTVVIPQPNLPEVVTVAEGIVTPDPFRDVIHTEPAPNLQSLIGDIMPFLQRQTTTTQKTPIYVTTSTEAPNNSSDDADEDLFNFNSVLKLFFPDEKVENATSPPEMNATTAKSVPPAPTSPPESKNSIDTVGLLKLAGCNIYGRMYRVGRIISELSNPCLECMCTEVGVQCRNLVC